MNKQSKKQWKDQAKYMFDYIILDLLKKIQTKSIRLILSASDIPEEYRRSSCLITAYKKEQNYKFYIDFDNDFAMRSNVTNIYVVQEEMSRENAFSHIELSTNCNICDLDKEKLEGFRDSLVAFLLANMVWK